MFTAEPNKSSKKNLMQHSLGLF